MFKTLRIFTAVAMLLTAMSCGEPEEAPYLSISFPSVSVDEAGKTVDLTVYSNTSWSASSDASWITVSPTSGSGNVDVKVTVAENKD
ncbi:MAG: BACON domain-containing protein, partial [Bacteroidales bacterium]|nr:BACON domain-containing protein [Bacteroidales bacterium]